MKVLFSKGRENQVVFDMVADGAPEPPDTHAVPFDDFTAGEMPAAWAERRVWDDATGAPRLPTPTEDLQAAKDEATVAVREAAARESDASASPVEHRAVGRRWARPNTQLTPREQTLLNSDDARYSKLIGLLEQIDAATTPEAARSVVW